MRTHIRSSTHKLSEFNPLLSSKTFQELPTESISPLTTARRGLRTNVHGHTVKNHFKSLKWKSKNVNDALKKQKQLPNNFIYAEYTSAGKVDAVR